MALGNPRYGPRLRRLQETVSSKHDPSGRLENCSSILSTENPTPSLEAVTDFLLKEENLSDKNEGAPEDAGEFIVGERKQSVYNVTLGNLNLATIMHGFPHDPIELRLFDFVFQRTEIISW